MVAQSRSRVTNGADILAGIDGRSEAARRYRDLGGIALSEARMQLVRRFAATAVLAEATEARLVNGEVIDVTEYSQLSSTLVRLATRIGLDRVPRDITPATLSDYVAARRAEAEAAEQEADE
jgi:hypothetical protein